MTIDIDPGSKFPDLKKAELGLKLDDLIKGFLNDDKEFYQLAEDKKKDLRKQRNVDLKSFVLGLAGATKRGNDNACDQHHNIQKITDNQREQQQPIPVPGTKPKSPLGKKDKKTKLPKRRSATPTTGERARPASVSRFKVNQATRPAVSDRSHFIQPVETSNYPEKAKRNAEQFVAAQQGKRGHSVGDRAVVFSGNGTPHYGDSYLDKANVDNLAANQAIGNAPISQIPSKIEQGQPISANPLQAQPRANVAPKSDTTGNLIALGAIAAAVTAVLFFFQHVLIFVELILQISSVTSTITNIAGSFVAILNTTGSLFGLGEGLLKPLESTFDSMLNNVFGRDKVDYVKYQFAKISSTFVAGQNIISKATNMHNSLASVSEDNANNTSKIGNALKALGMLATGEGWMREDNKIAQGIGKLGTKLDTVSGLSSSLTEITSDVKTAKEQQETLDKQYEETKKSIADGEKKATEKHEDKTIPQLPEKPEGNQ